MERWRNKVAVVTGASAGIGVAIIRKLLENGLSVVGLARRIELMDKIKRELPSALQANYDFFRCDISNAQSVNFAFDRIIEKFGAVDVMINTAGIMNCGALLTMDVADVQAIFNTNVMGVVHCTQRAFKSMKDRNFDGHIMIFNSIVSHAIPCFPKEFPPKLAPYIASKHALKAMVESYRQELNHFDTKIKITSISPGITDTDMVYDWLREACGHNFLHVNDIADGVIYALSTPPHVQVHELTIKPIAEFVS